MRQYRLSSHDTTRVGPKQSRTPFNLPSRFSASQTSIPSTSRCLFHKAARCVTARPINLSRVGWSERASAVLAAYTAPSVVRELLFLYGTQRHKRRFLRLADSPQAGDVHTRVRSFRPQGVQ